jgi:hypothetical protein
MEKRSISKYWRIYMFPEALNKRKGRFWNAATFLWACYVSVEMHLACAERLEGIYSYSVLENVYVIGRCPMNVNELAPKLSAIKIDLTQLNDYFLWSVPQDIYYFLENNASVRNVVCQI